MSSHRKRSNFTETQKADIYVRDHATCAFSGISLWIFDYGIRRNYQMDWADHIKPSARGGDSTLENGICASHTFNAKKKDNGSDNIFFFKNGKITPAYVETFGCAPDYVLEDLERRSNLLPADWFLNRAITNTFIGFEWRCDLEFQGIQYKRDDTYWFKSAFRRLNVSKRKNPSSSIVERQLLPPEIPFGTELLLDIESVTTEQQFKDWAESVWPSYRASVKAFHTFSLAETAHEQDEVLEQLKAEKLLHPDILKGLAQLRLDEEFVLSKAA